MFFKDIKCDQSWREIIRTFLSFKSSKDLFMIIISTGKQMLDKIQPDSNGTSYGTLPDGSDPTQSQSGEKKEA